jgi:hypothetical protein
MLFHRSGRSEVSVRCRSGDPPVSPMVQRPAQVWPPRARAWAGRPPRAAPSFADSDRVHCQKEDASATCATISLHDSPRALVGSHSLRQPDLSDRPTADLLELIPEESQCFVESSWPRSWPDAQRRGSQTRRTATRRRQRHGDLDRPQRCPHEAADPARARRSGGADCTRSGRTRFVTSTRSFHARAGEEPPACG